MSVPYLQFLILWEATARDQWIDKCNTFRSWDDECHVSVTQSCQLICFLHQDWPPSGELLRACFCRVSHQVV